MNRDIANWTNHDVPGSLPVGAAEKRLGVLADGVVPKAKGDGPDADPHGRALHFDPDPGGPSLESRL